MTWKAIYEKVTWNYTNPTWTYIYSLHNLSIVPEKLCLAAYEMGHNYTQDTSASVLSTNTNRSTRSAPNRIHQIEIRRAIPSYRQKRRTTSTTASQIHSPTHNYLTIQCPGTETTPSHTSNWSIERGRVLDTPTSESTDPLRIGWGDGKPVDRQAESKWERT